MSQRSDVLILTSRGGQGLITGALALREALIAEEPSLNIPIVDFFNDGGSSVGALLTDCYNWLLRRSLRWSSIYIRALHLLRLDRWSALFGSSLQNYKRLIAEYRPRAIVLTSQYIIGAVASARERVGDRTPLIVANVDPGEHCVPLWFHPNIDLHLLPTPATLVAYRRASGQNSSDAAIVKLLARQSYLQIRERPRPEVRAELGLPVDKSLVVFTGSREGNVEMKRLALLTLQQTDATVVVMCGNNSALKCDLERRTQVFGSRATVLGWTADPARYIRAADLVVAKPGKQTMCEALATGTPLVAICYPAVMPQERSNVEFLKDHHVLIESRSRPDTLRLIVDLLRDARMLDALQETMWETGRRWVDPSVAAKVLLDRFDLRSIDKPTASMTKAQYA